MCARVRVRRTRLVRVRCDIHRYGTYRNTRVFGRRRFAYVLQPTFGYILGFLIAAPVGGFVARGLKNDARLNVFRLLLGAFCSLAIVYTVGVFYMYLMLNYYVGTAMSMSKAWMAGCAVFLPTDCSWCVVGSLVTYAVLKRYNPRLTVKKGYESQTYVREID